MTHERQSEGTAMTTESILAEIRRERERQMQAEGWTPEYDDDHVDGELATAAACYALGHAELSSVTTGDNWSTLTRVSLWPFEGMWKPRDGRSNLIKAGALIVAELERIDRLDRLARETAGKS